LSAGCTTFATGLDPVVELVKINRHGEHQQAGRDEIFAAPRAASESATGDGSGAFDADVTGPAPPRGGNPRLEFGPLCGKQRSPWSSEART